MKRKHKIILFSVISVVACAAIVITGILWHKGPYTAEQLGISTVLSDRDDDGDGVDNYTDIMLTARAYVGTKPNYLSSYYAGGYPNDGNGVCTDVIWQAFMGAGIDLKALVDKDIAEYPEAYPHITKADPNIDFRRVRNLNIFFRRHAESLTCDLSDPEQFQPGDIIVIDPSHIAICSDKRNRRGVPYIIHHSPLGAVESDDLYLYTIVAHYRPAIYPGK